MMMAFYGAKVIHPKTIRPLQRKNIPLYVKSFFDPDGKGTVVHSDAIDTPKTTSFMVKKNQALISVYPSEFSFITSEDMSKIFGLLHKYSLTVNLMQNTALRFSFCIDHHQEKTNGLLKNLEAGFESVCTPNLEVITIRHYTDKDIRRVIAGRTVIMEQRSPITAQFVVEASQ
jgi:aspartate kinase